MRETTTKDIDAILGDIWDSRDVIERVEDLEGYLPDIDDDDMEELRRLRAIVDECSGVSDWQYGEAFISEAYFETYARELAEEIGAVDDDAAWPARCIDWEQAADELKQDYSSYEVEGVTYWARA